MIKKVQYEILFEAIKYGLNITDSCRKASISKDTYFRKLKRDKKFEDRVEKALIEFKQRLIISIQKAGLDPARWTAHAWMLERKFPDEFGIRQKVEHSGNVDDPLRIIYVPAKTNRNNGDIPKKQGK